MRQSAAEASGRGLLSEDPMEAGCSPSHLGKGAAGAGEMRAGARARTRLACVRKSRGQGPGKGTSEGEMRGPCPSAERAGKA